MVFRIENKTLPVDPPGWCCIWGTLSDQVEGLKILPALGLMGVGGQAHHPWVRQTTACHTRSPRLAEARDIRLAVNTAGKMCHPELMYIPQFQPIS